MVKKFEFFGVTPIVAPPVFVRFRLFLISTYSKKFDPSGSNDLKLQNFGGPD